jgi:hypothetical protein
MVEIGRYHFSRLSVHLPHIPSSIPRMVNLKKKHLTDVTQDSTFTQIFQKVTVV